MYRAMRRRLGSKASKASALKERAYAYFCEERERVERARACLGSSKASVKSKERVLLRYSRNILRVASILSKE